MQNTAIYAEKISVVNFFIQFNTSVVSRPGAEQDSGRECRRAQQPVCIKLFLCVCSLRTQLSEVAAAAENAVYLLSDVA